MPHSVVSLTYNLKLADGEVVETATDENPFEFIVGINFTLPGFDIHLLGLTIGDHFDFLLQPEEAFGKIDETLILEVPVDNFKGAPEGTIELMKTLPMVDSEGNTIFGVITEITDEIITMDFNHPLAGEPLNFSGTIMTVRRAKPSELESGKVDPFKLGGILDN